MRAARPTDPNVPSPLPVCAAPAAKISASTEKAPAHDVPTLLPNITHTHIIMSATDDIKNLTEGVNGASLHDEEEEIDFTDIEQKCVSSRRESAKHVA